MESRSDLFRAIEEEDVDNLTYLIACGTDVNAKHEYGLTPLTYALKFGRSKEIIDILIKNNANVNLKDEYGDSPLMYAKKKEHVELLIDAGADVNSSDLCGRPSYRFIYCNKKGCDCEEIIILLVKNGFNVNRVGFHGNTYLHLAKCKKVINALVRFGASLEIMNGNGLTPLMYTVKMFSYHKKIRTLLTLGANPNCRDYSYNTPLHFARDSNTVYELIYHGADLNAQNIDSEKPIRSLLNNFYYDSFEAILKYLMLIDDKSTNFVLQSQTIYDSLTDEERTYFLNLPFTEWRTQLYKMKTTFVKGDLTFYDICRINKSNNIKLINILDSEYYLNDYDLIRSIFPDYFGLIKINFEYYRIELWKYDFFKTLDHLVLCARSPHDNAKLDCYSVLNICKYLNHQQRYNLFLASL